MRILLLVKKYLYVCGYITMPKSTVHKYLIALVIMDEATSTQKLNLSG